MGRFVLVNLCIELITDGIAHIVRPAHLTFESFDDDPEWNYFRLETETLEPCGVYEANYEHEGSMQTQNSVTIDSKNR
jgi:hypothetical protein